MANETFDPWEGDDGRYDRDRWYTRSTNEHDHSAHIRLNIPKQQGGQIDRFVRDPKIPEIRSREDFIRDSINHNLVYRREMMRDQELNRQIDLELLACELDEQYRAILEMEHFVESHHQMVYKARMTKSHKALETGLSAALIGLDRMDGEPKEQLLGIIHEYEVALTLFSDA